MMKRFLLSVSVLLVVYFCCGQHISIVLALAVVLGLVFSRLSREAPGLSDGSGRAVLVTGCDSGFGHGLAQKLDRLGFTVFAGCLSADGPGARRLVEEGSDRIKVLQLDVTRDDDVNQAKSFVLANLPEKGLYGVVNNAGVGDWAETEWCTVQDFMKISDVNLFGPVRVTIAFLPLVRASRGRLLYVSSIFSFFNCLTMGAYSVSKRGLEAFADCLRVEMASFGVEVSIIQPGNFSRATNVQPRKTAQDIWDGFDEARKRTFNRTYVEMACECFQTLCASGFQDCSMVVDAMTHALTAFKPQSRYLLVSWRDVGFFYLYPFLPVSIADQLFTVSSMYKKRQAMLYA